MLKCCPFKAKSCRSETMAQVVDGKLILSFLEAETPVVWQMDLPDVKASALEVHHDKAQDLHILRRKAAQAEQADIAAFKTHEKAVEALRAVSVALQAAHGSIRVAAAGEGTSYTASSVQSAGMRPEKSRKGLWIAVVLIALFLFVLMSIWGSVSTTHQARLASSSPSSAAANGPGQSGVPLSADEFLRGR